jgi:hypothetical protein
VQRRQLANPGGVLAGDTQQCEPGRLDGFQDFSRTECELTERRLDADFPY